jgi:peptide/nickel transport system permease protein
MILPGIAMAAGSFGLLTRMVRVSVKKELTKDYVRTARAKGLLEGKILRGHVLRNAMNPIVTTIGVQTGYMFCGTVLIERIFSWHGLGNFVYNSIVHMDFMSVMTSAVVMATIFMVINIVVDMLYAAINPEVRLS